MGIQTSLSTQQHSGLPSLPHLSFVLIYCIFGVSASMDLLNSFDKMHCIENTVVARLPAVYTG